MVVCGFEGTLFGGQFKGKLNGKPPIFCTSTALKLACTASKQLWELVL